MAIANQKIGISNLIQENLNSISLFESAINSNSHEKSQFNEILASIFSFSYQNLIANYTLGNRALKPFFLKMKNSLKRADFDIGYYECIWTISIGILLEIKPDEMKPVIDSIQRRKHEGYVLDFLISYYNKNHKINSPEKWKPYTFLVPAIENDSKIQAQLILRNYLEKKWYSGHSDAYWHNSHKSPHNTYFGYWSFEAAAIVKIMELDDSSFKDNQYYPYDLVHWKE